MKISKTSVVISFPAVTDGYWFTSFTYSAGESQVRLNKDQIQFLIESDEIVIKARIASARDLVELVLLSQAVYYATMKYQTLRLAYLPYSRADRRFVIGDCAGLQMLGQILGLVHWNRIETLDVHNSGRATEYVRSLFNVEPTRFIELTKLAIGTGSILYPDEGAAVRYNQEVSWPVFYATKVRDPETGKLSGFDVPRMPDGNVLIVDDICDGGGTFIGIAEQLNRSGWKGLLYLYVSHGIFSKGLPLLLQHFQQIYTTDSVRDHVAFQRTAPDKLVVFKTWD